MAAFQEVSSAVQYLGVSCDTWRLVVLPGWLCAVEGPLDEQRTVEVRRPAVCHPLKDGSRAIRNVKVRASGSQQSRFDARWW